MYEVVVRMFNPLNDTIGVRVLEIEADGVEIEGGSVLLRRNPARGASDPMFFAFSNWLSVKPCEPKWTIQSS